MAPLRSTAAAGRTSVRHRTDALVRLTQTPSGCRNLECQDPTRFPVSIQEGHGIMNRIIWLVGAVVIILFVLGYFGLR